MKPTYQDSSTDAFDPLRLLRSHFEGASSIVSSSMRMLRAANPPMAEADLLSYPTPRSASCSYRRLRCRKGPQSTCVPPPTRKRWKIRRGSRAISALKTGWKQPGTGSVQELHVGFATGDANRLAQSSPFWAWSMPNAMV